MDALFAATNNADINDVHAKGGSHGSQTPNKGPPGSTNMGFGGIAWHQVISRRVVCVLAM